MKLSEAYQILGVELGASEATVREAHRDMVTVWHPGRYEHDPRLRVKAIERLRSVDEATRLIEEAGFPSGENCVASEPLGDHRQPGNQQTNSQSGFLPSLPPDYCQQSQNQSGYMQLPGDSNHPHAYQPHAYQQPAYQIGRAHV